MKLKDIPQFTRRANYSVNVSWFYLEKHLEGLAETIGTNFGLDLDPDFQRGHVWDRNKQVAYIEFVLRGGRSSRELLFNCAGWNQGNEGPVTIVDGKQRLEAVRSFIRDEFRVFDHLASEFDKSILRRADFVFSVNDLPNRIDVLQWYLELNSGGVVHTDDELERVRGLLQEERSKSQIAGKI